MNRLSNVISQSLAIALFLFFIPATSLYAAAGCCSHHGGVSGCNAATNHESCKDGTSSPTCLCNGEKVAKPATVTKEVKTKSTTTTAATATTPSTTSTTTAATTTTKSTKGCCAKHGGVAKCDAASGFQMCKDGTRSSSCKC